MVWDERLRREAADVQRFFRLLDLIVVVVG
jgi:hypothetical protein